MGWGDGPHDFSVSPFPLGTNLGFDLGSTGLGLGRGGLGTKGLGQGLFILSHCTSHCTGGFRVCLICGIAQKQFKILYTGIGYWEVEITEEY